MHRQRRVHETIAGQGQHRRCLVEDGELQGHLRMQARALTGLSGSTRLVHAARLVERLRRVDAMDGHIATQEGSDAPFALGRIRTLGECQARALHAQPRRSRRGPRLAPAAERFGLRTAGKPRS